MAERYADAHLIETAVNSDGSAEAIYSVDASDVEAVHVLKKGMDEHFGLESTIMTKEEYEKRSAFGFSAKNWKMCNWEPKGPKKNWIIEPPDPRAN